MKSHLTRAAVVSAALLVTGCASMSEEECRVADWRMIGYEDGAEGIPQGRLGDHREACADYGVVPDMSAYRAGHEEGVKLYCTESVGFERGRSGGSYRGACPSALEREFLDGYEVGREIWAAFARVDEAESSIASIERRVERLEKDIARRERELIADETASDRRAALLDDIKRDQARLGELQSEKELLLLDLGRLRAEAEAVDAHYRLSRGGI